MKKWSPPEIRGEGAGETTSCFSVKRAPSIKNKKLFSCTRSTVLLVPALVPVVRKYFGQDSPRSLSIIEGDGSVLHDWQADDLRVTNHALQHVGRHVGDPQRTHMVVVVLCDE
jgi:hypothetical protein